MAEERPLDLLEEARRVLKVEADAINRMSVRLDEGFSRAVELIHSSQGRVIITGMGKSGLIGKKIAATFASTGTPAFSMHPGEASHGDLGMVTKEDIIIAISNSGETEEVLALLPFINSFGLLLITMTGNTSSSLASAADVNLDVSVECEACSLDIVPTASTTATLAMGDALAVALLKSRGFREEDFAAFHPKGTLGKKLLLRVEDVMRSGDDMPIISLDTPMEKAVIEISSKRLGMTTVLDSEGRLSGIITDGDLRRGIEKSGKGFFDLKAGEAMISAPKSVSSGELAAKALAVMEKHSITALVVINGDNIPKGIIHIHDVLREGLV
ncbi:SIS domain-containing protein [Nitrospirota bacterium]